MKQHRILIVGRCILCIVALLGVAKAYAEEAILKPADIFTDHMLLQRDQPIDIWGTSVAGSEVMVKLGEQDAVATADKNGFWKATLKSMEASGPFELKISSGESSKVFKDIMIGDLWIISGQSNVVLPLCSGKEWGEVKKLPTFENIRICKLPGNFSFEPADHYSRPIKWQQLNTAKAGSFLSGVGYHFIRTIQPGAGIPVGLLQASSGGTQIEQWMPLQALQEADSNNIQFAMKEKALQKFAKDPKAKVGGIHTGVATFFNGVIYPVRFLKFAGVVWYQGEANSRVKADYRMLLKVFSDSWRKLFSEPHLPFIIVQLPGFGLAQGDGWMKLQESQMLASNDLGFPLVVTIDQGSKKTIHPPDKMEVGRRAGLAALQHVYKQDIDGTSPMPLKINFNDGKAAVEFGGFKGDLVVKGDTVKGFEIAAENGKYQPAIAELNGTKVVVYNPEIKSPKFVRYLWINAPDEVTLFSAAGLPAAPFRSEALSHKK